MADSIVKLRVDTKDYDQKIDSARRGLLAMEQACRKVDGTLAIVEKDELAFARALGNMSTQSNTAKGKINELTNAFRDVSTMYNRLTDEEKSSPFGQALSQSLEQLKGRIQAGNDELRNIQGELGNTKGFVEQLTDKLGINVGTLTKFAGVSAVATTALKVAKDAFMSNESQVDEWGRTVEAAQSVYESFCVNLNNGSLDGWFNSMDNLIKKAKDAYDAVDKLNTYMTVINPERVKVQGQISEQKEIIRKKGKNSTEGKAAQDKIKELEPQLKKTYDRESQMNYEAFEAIVKKRLAEDKGLHLSKNDFDHLMDSFSNSSSLDYINSHAGTTRQRVKVNKGMNSYGADQYDYKEVPNKYKRIQDLFTDEWRQQNSSYLTASFSAHNAKAMVGVQDARYLSGSTGTTATKSGKSAKDTAKDVQNQLDLTGAVPVAIQGIDSVAAFSMKTIAELQAQKNALDKRANNSIVGSGDYTYYKNASKSVGNSIKNANITSSEGIVWDTQGMLDDIQSALDNNMFIAKVSVDDGEGTAKNAKQTALAWQNATAAISNAGSALQNLEDPSAKVAGIVMQAIANVALGFAQAAASPATGAAGVFGWIAAATAGVATMTATIAQIKSATSSYAEGGQLKGSSFTGDAIPFMGNAGEIVLSAAQTERVAGQLQGGAQNTASARPFLTMDKLYLGLDNFGMSHGKGHLMFAKS